MSAFPLGTIAMIRVKGGPTGTVERCAVRVQGGWAFGAKHAAWRWSDANVISVEVLSEPVPPTGARQALEAAREAGTPPGMEAVARLTEAQVHATLEVAAQLARIADAAVGGEK